MDGIGVRFSLGPPVKIFVLVSYVSKRSNMGERGVGYGKFDNDGADRADRVGYQPGDSYAPFRQASELEDALLDNVDLGRIAEKGPIELEHERYRVALSQIPFKVEQKKVDKTEETEAVPVEVSFSEEKKASRRERYQTAKEELSQGVDSLLQEMMDFESNYARLANERGAQYREVADLEAQFSDLLISAPVPYQVYRFVTGLYERSGSLVYFRTNFFQAIEKYEKTNPGITDILEPIFQLMEKAVVIKTNIKNVAGKQKRYMQGDVGSYLARYSKILKRAQKYDKSFGKIGKQQGQTLTEFVQEHLVKTAKTKYALSSSIRTLLSKIESPAS
jgi:hypothetical protein